jgi:hypothetical protein
VSPGTAETPEPESAPASPDVPAEQLAAAEPPVPAWTPPVPVEPEAEPVTASGLPNPHGLPEIAVERPEVAVGAAFAGGLVLALILKRLGR